jgi:hypothetical protein
VVTPDGEVVDILRVDVPGVPEKAAIVSISEDGTEARFDPSKGFIDLPGGAKKFTIRYDEKSGRYWMLSSVVLESDRDRKPASVRNVLALSSSKDLRHWRVVKVLVKHPDVRHHGFQYPDWLFDGDDLVAVVRTAFDDREGGAHNAHDANYLTFHRIKGFRELLKGGEAAGPKRE